MVGEALFTSGATDPTSAAEPALPDDLTVRRRALDLLAAFHSVDTTTVLDILIEADLPAEGVDLVLAVAEMSLDMLTRWSPVPLADIGMKRLELTGSQEVTQAMEQQRA